MNLGLFFQLDWNIEKTNNCFSFRSILSKEEKRGVVLLLNSCSLLKLKTPNFPNDTWIKSISTQISLSSSAEYVKDVRLQIKEILLNILDASRVELMKEDVMKQHVKI